MHDTRAFYPLYTQSQPAPPSGGSAQQGTLQPSVTVVGAVTNTFSTAFAGSVASNSGYQSLQIANKTSAWAHINLGVVGNIPAATVASSIPVAPGAVVVLSIHPEVNGAAVIMDAAPASATSVIFTRGDGV